MDMGLEEFLDGLYGHNLQWYKDSSDYDHIMIPFFDELDNMELNYKKKLYEAIDKNFLVVREGAIAKTDLSVYYPSWKRLYELLGKSFTEGCCMQIWTLYNLGNLSLGDVIKKFVLQSIVHDGRSEKSDVKEYENILSVIDFLNQFQTKIKHGFDKGSIKIALNKFNLSEFDFFSDYGYMLSYSQLEKALIKTLNKN
jgi:hypothetical protein